jgi:hypothetical protein
MSRNAVVERALSLVSHDQKRVSRALRHFIDLIADRFTRKGLWQEPPR